MLERDTLVVCSEGPKRFRILCPVAGKVVGEGRDLSGFLATALRRVFGKRLTRTVVEVREKPDDSLVFNIEKIGILTSRLMVRDAMGRRVGQMEASSLTFRIFEKDNALFATAAGPRADLRFVSDDGSRELGRITRIPSEQSGTDTADGAAEASRLSFSPELEDQPLAKMLLLAAALVLEWRWK